MSLAEDVRAEIRTALHDTHTSQAELSRRLGMSTKHVSQVLTGRAALSLDLAEAMLAAVGRQMTVRTKEVTKLTEGTPAMKIYVLNRTKGTGYDEADGFVVAAETPAKARAEAAEEAGDEGGHTWLSADLSTCKEISAKWRAGVILRSYNAG